MAAMATRCLDAWRTRAWDGAHLAHAMVDGDAKVTRLLDNNPRPMTRADLRAIYEQLI